MPSIYQVGVNSQEQQQILTLHNQFRSMIMQGKVKGQPKGYHLHMLKWDDKLAEAAQALASSGRYEHNDVKDERFPVGQNLYKGMSTKKEEGSDWNRAVNSWYDERDNYKFGAKHFASNVGHYTQLVWGNTKCVGCGYAHTSSHDSKFKYQKLYVCNYGPAGNFVGKPPYDTKD